MASSRSAWTTAAATIVQDTSTMAEQRRQHQQHHHQQLVLAMDDYSQMQLQLQQPRRLQRSTSTSSESDPLRSRRTSVDDHVYDELLAKVSQLIARMFSDDASELECDTTSSTNSSHNNSHSSMNPEDGEHTRALTLTDTKQHRQRSKSATVHRSFSLTREVVLQEKLAQALVELAVEQDNLQLAASAGKELLEQLSDARDDAKDLQAQLRASQQRLSRAEMEKTWLLEQQQVMELELMQLRPSYATPRITTSASSTSSRSSRSSRASSHEQLWIGWEGTAATPHEQSAVECRACPQRTAELRTAVHEINALKRKCLELETQTGKQRARSDELWLEHESLRAANAQLQAERDAAKRDAEFAHVQRAQLERELAETVAARENLRVSARRLECETDLLVQRLEGRDAQLAGLESDKRAAGTTAQVLANRVTSLEIENKKLVAALSESQRLTTGCDHTVSTQSQSHKSQALDHDDEQQSEGSVSLQQHARDLEQLFDEAQREVAALKLENRLLRRQLQQQQQPPRSSVADVANKKLRRVKSMTSRTTTCATILAVDEALLVANRRSSESLELLDAEPVASPMSSSRKSRRSVAPSEVPSSSESPSFFERFVTSRRRHSASHHSDSDHGGVDKAPLYVGISVLACATAAAGLLARR